MLAADSDTVTITAVDLTRSYVLIDASTDSTTGSSGYQSWGVVGTLTDSTTLTLQRDGGVADAEVTWSVVTCDQGEFLVVDGGSFQIGSGDTTNTEIVNEFDTARTLIIYGSRGNFPTGSSNVGFATCKANSSTELEVERGTSSTTRTVVHYQLIEWSLESGVTVANGVHDGTGLLGTSEDTSAHGVAGVTLDGTTKVSNCWLFAQSRHEHNGLEQCSVRARFDTTNVLFQRHDHAATTYNSHIAWQLVKFPVDCCVHRTPSMSSGDTTKDTSLSPVSLDTGATIVWQTNTCNGTGTAFGRNAWNVQVLDSSTIRQKRSYSGQAVYSAVSVCDFSLLDNVSNTFLLDLI